MKEEILSSNASGSGEIPLHQEAARCFAVEEYLLKLTSETDPSRMLDLVTETAARLINAETLVVPLLSPDNTTVSYDNVYGKHGDIFRGMSFPIENAGLCGWVLENRKPILSLDLLEDPRVKKELAKALGLTCAVLVPLIARDRIIGGISAFNKTDGSLFTDDDTEVLTRFANFAAVAVDNVRLLEDFRRLAHQNEMILNSAGEGIYGLDMDGRITFMNPAGEKMLGWGIKEVAGLEAHVTFHHSRPGGGSYDSADCPLVTSLKVGLAVHIEEDIFWKKDGTSFPVEYTCIPMKDGDSLSGAVVTIRDITERKAAADEITKRVRELEKFSKLTVGREMRIIELKKEVESLKSQLETYRPKEQK